MQQIPKYMRGTRILNLTQKSVVYRHTHIHSYTYFKSVLVSYNRKHKVFYKILYFKHNFIKVYIQKTGQIIDP